MEAAASPSPTGVVELGWARRIKFAQAAIGLTLLALCVRLVGLTSRPLWLDESFSGWFAERNWRYLWSVVPTFEPHPPFYYSLLRLWLAVAPDSAAGIRSLSVILGIAAVPLIMAAAREQEYQEPSARPLVRFLCAGFLASCAPMLIAVDQEARPYPLLILAYSVAVLALLRLMREFANGTPGAWQSWLLLGFGTELTLWSHALGVLYAASLFLALCPAWLHAASRDRLVRGAATGGAIALGYVPCLLLTVGRAHDWGMNWLAWRPRELWQLATLYTVPIDVMTVGAAVGAIAMVLLIKRAIELALSAKGWNSQRALLVLWFGPPLMAAVISALFVPVFLERTLVATLTPAYLALADALARTQSGSERRLLMITLGLTLVPTAVQTAARPPMERWDEVAGYLHRNVHTTDEIWLYPTDSALPLGRTGQSLPGHVRTIPSEFPTLTSKGPIRAGWPAVVSVTREQANRIASDPALRRVPTIWLVTRQPGIFDPEGDMPAALAQVRRSGPAQDWGYIEVRPYYAR
jgi:hypothetical protein